MAIQSVQVRPQKAANADVIETFIESLIGRTVSTTASMVPVFSFQTTEENVNKIKEKFGDEVIVDVV
ncbi:hypothetical protein ACSS6W_007498 [Trichoderma asperelloides]|uniref:Uncharacterized protein n=1 Tax=Trichoderma asperellum TaxID=101201 RepID=A0A6V8QZE1_TRIAP|nr:hypothetical protein LI328DRAFT_135158 [Trichoderma asperelloides]GFP57690.1 hypothetical protein TASIC1_0009002700 [Trichoderma asperellum]